MKQILLIGTLLIMSLSVIGCVKKTAPATQHYPTSSTSSMDVIAPTTRVNPPSLMPTLGKVHQLHTLQGPTLIIAERGNGFTFPQYQGKIVLLQVFGKDCPHCFDEMPTITRLQRTYAQRLQVVALHADEPMSRREAKMLIQKFQMHYPIVDRDEARDILLFIQNTYEWRGTLPYTLIIKNGVTEFSYVGEVSPQELEGDLRTLL
jgi:thiol-disulfide isomerase/thioredoxin